MLLLNAFSLSMVTTPCKVAVETISTEQAAKLVQGGFNSAVGHADTAAIISSVLGVDVGVNRVSVALKTGESAVVAQYKGPRLAEGTTTLPEGSEMAFMLVTVE